MQCESGRGKWARVLSEVLDPSLREIVEAAFQKLSEGYFEDARDAFTDYLLVESQDAKAYAGRAMAYFQLKDWPSALADFKKAGELDPGDLENPVGCAMSLAMDNKIYEAIGIFEKLLADHPDFVRGYIQLGQLYYRLGAITKGHAQMDLALAARPSLAERRQIEQIKKPQMELDKKRFYRPDFEALRKANAPSGSWINKIKDFLKSLGKK